MKNQIFDLSWNAPFYSLQQTILQIFIKPSVIFPIVIENYCPQKNDIEYWKIKEVNKTYYLWQQRKRYAIEWR